MAGALGEQHFELCSGLCALLASMRVFKRSSFMFLAYACRGIFEVGNVFAYDLEGKLVRDHLFNDILSWNQCPPATAVGLGS